ncbi:hypothetical protein, partial [Mesorhizobium sp.]
HRERKLLPMYPVQSVTHLSAGHRQGNEGQRCRPEIGDSLSMIFKPTLRIEAQSPTPALPLIRPSGTFSPWNGEKEKGAPQYFSGT